MIILLFRNPRCEYPRRRVLIVHRTPTRANLQPASKLVGACLPATVRRIAQIGLVMGVALWLWLVWRAGPTLLLDYLAQTGWWMLVLLGIAAVRNGFRAVACRWAMAEDRVQLPLPAVYNILLISQAIQFVTFAGSVFGESAKALLFSRRVSAARAVSATVLDVLLYQFSAGLFVLLGMALLVWVAPVAPGLRGWLWATAVLVTALLVLVVVGFARQWHTTRSWLARMGRGGRAFAGLRSWLQEKKVADAGDQVAQFHSRHPRLFYQILFLPMLAHAASAFEVLLVMQLLDLPAGFSAAVVVESVGKLLRITGHFVPGSIGFFEGGVSLIVSALGSPLAMGTALALVIQVRSILWAGIGFLVLLWFTGRERVG